MKPTKLKPRPRKVPAVPCRQFLDCGGTSLLVEFKAIRAA